MTHPNPRLTDDSKFIIRGVHLELTDSLRQAAHDKASRLLRHNEHIDRIRIEVELDQSRGTNDRFIAKGRLEMPGPDLVASAHSEDAYKSIDLLVDTLDALLRTRHGLRKERRNHPQAIELEAELPKV
jgi:putative sigma-54 modulation protein